jgi:hypothetical protein
METNLCVVVPNTCGSSIRDLLIVNFLALRILRLLLDFWKTVQLCPSEKQKNTFKMHAFIIALLRMTSIMLLVTAPRKSELMN